MCLPKNVRTYISHHLRDDAENHRSMTSQEYHDSHNFMWEIIDWPTWKELMEAQGVYSDIAAKMVDEIPTCREG